MADPVLHDGEDLSNALRTRLAAVQGAGQRTWTPSQAVVRSAEGVWLTTVEGRRLIDFASGVLVANLGHGHTGFETRLARYRAELPRNTYNLVTEIEVLASERLVASLAPVNRNAQKTLWAASGSEAVQKAMWAALARRPDRPIIAATRHGFHGKKGLAADVTGATSKNPNVRFISFPMGETRDEAFYQAELDRLAAEHAGRIALLITEPYLGAAGSYHPPVWYHQMLARWCREHDIPFIFDEVQSCFGRTGRMYACETYGVEPDLVVLGKGVANGVPAAVTVGRGDLIDALTWGEASDTFSAHPEACAAVCATLDVFGEERIVAHVQEVAPRVRAGLEALAARYAFVRAVRGEGLVYGVELADADAARACVLEAYRGADGMGVHFLGPLAEKVLRVSPPLTIHPTEIDEAFALLTKAWDRIAR